MKVVEVNPKKLKPAEYNPRQMTEKQAADLRESIKKFGLVDPIIVNSHKGRENIVIGGHQRLKIAISEGFKTVPAVYVDLTVIREQELNLRLNKNLGEWDWDMLSNFDLEMLKDVGFQDDELAKGLGIKSDIDEDEAPPLPEEPQSKLGEIYKLGNHRVMCGDATSSEDIKSLLGKESADMVFTDPPYNVNYEGSGKNTSNKILNDNMSDSTFYELLRASFQNMADSTKDVAPWYVCHSHRSYREFEQAIRAAGYIPKSQIIWEKPSATMGWQEYRSRHEPILYCHRKDESPRFLLGRDYTTIWKQEPGDHALLQWLKQQVQKDYDGTTTIWTLGRDPVSGYKHPTQKPLALCARAIEHSTMPGDSVLDIFAGSGSTLVAAEKMGRTCYAMELDPKYVDVIIKRWENVTNNKAEKL